MRLSGFVARLVPSPLTTEAWRVRRSGTRHSTCTPMSRFGAALNTTSERSVVSSVVEESNASRENGTRNWPTVPDHRSWLSRMKRSVAERVSGERAGVAAALGVRISTWAR